MKTIQEQKAFALAQIAPYYKDKSLCGFNKTKIMCEYLTEDGNMCVAGKNMLEPEKWGTITIIEILKTTPQDKVFKPEAVDVLTTNQWGRLQFIHDVIGFIGIDAVKSRIKILGLFTLKELQEAANKL